MTANGVGGPSGISVVLEAAEVLKGVGLRKKWWRLGSALREEASGEALKVAGEYIPPGDPARGELLLLASSCRRGEGGQALGTFALYYY